MGKLRVSQMWCEYSRNPLGIDSASPRLNWVLEADERGQLQTAYQVLVSGSSAFAEKCEGDIWNSGKIISDQSWTVFPPQYSLKYSGKKFWWRVKVWDRRGETSEYSEIDTFEFGLLDPKDWQGTWIGGGNMLRGAFSAQNKGIASARIYVAGLGFYELSINGAKVGDRVLSPAWTDYGKRVLYDTFDVTKFVLPGENVVGISLGIGRYEPAKESDLTKAGYGPVKTLVQLNIEYNDGSKQCFITNTSDWKCSEGPVVSSDLFIGETYDARMEKAGWDTIEYEGSDFRASRKEEPPKGTLVSSATLPPIRVVGETVAREIFAPSAGIFIYDFGQNFSGWEEDCSSKNWNWERWEASRILV